MYPYRLPPFPEMELTGGGWLNLIKEGWGQPEIDYLSGSGLKVVEEDSGERKQAYPGAELRLSL